MNGNLYEWLEKDDAESFGESLDGESAEAIGDGEAYDESETGEAWSSKRREREARRRAALARARRSQAMQRRVAPTAASGLRMAQAEIEKVDLDNRVQSDVFGNAFKSYERRLSKDEYALVSQLIVGAVKDNFPELVDNPVFRDLLGAAPAILVGGKKNSLINPTTVAALSIGAIALIARTRNVTQVVTPLPGLPKSVAQGGQVQLFVEVRKANGTLAIPQPTNFAFSSLNTAVATVDPATGVVNGVAVGSTLITVSVPSVPNIEPAKIVFTVTTSTPPTP